MSKSRAGDQGGWKERAEPGLVRFERKGGRLTRFDLLFEVVAVQVQLDRMVGVDLEVHPVAFADGDLGRGHRVAFDRKRHRLLLRTLRGPVRSQREEQPAQYEDGHKNQS